MWLFLCLCAVAFAQEDGPRVNTTQGVVVGSHVTDGNYFAFYGIHYGGNTAGENRFKAPTPPPTYPGEYHAVDNNVICAQPSTRGLIGTENCLVLNIHTRNLTTPKPVLVWIEGEEYESTSSTLYPFKNLVQRDLLVVTINYRLSIFGFLCLGVAEAPGNAGLKDIIQGLRWIKQNIAGFGGDPNNVVLLGHGSGAAMVDLITLSPMSQNLTHKAIVLSGSGLAPWAVAYDPIGYAVQVGEKLSYTDTTREELAKKLASTDISLLSGVLTEFNFYNNTPLFAPCIENVALNPNDTFLSDAPINILRSGNYTHVPYIAGYTDREGTMRAPQAATENWLEKMEANFGEFIQVDLAFESEENRTAVTRSIREFYFDQRTVNMETIEDFLDYQGDSLILVPIVRATKERALTSTANVWLFKFTFRGTYNSDWAFPQIPLTGVRHGGILNYLFNFDLKAIDVAATEAVINRVTGFAHTGKPIPPLPATGTTWDPITIQLAPTLLLSGGETLANLSIFKEELLVNINRESTDFWDPILVTHYRPPRPVSSASNLLSFGLVILISQMLLRFVF